MYQSVMYHYLVTNSITEEIVLDSRRREDFNGYYSEHAAYMTGLGSKIENRLSDLHIVTVIN